MGVKGLCRIIDCLARSKYPFDPSRTYDLRIDFSGLAYFFSNGAVRGKASESSDEKLVLYGDHLVTCGDIEVDIQCLASMIMKCVDRTSIPKMKVTVCLDGSRRPACKKSENIKREQVASARNRFIRKVLSEYTNEIFVHMMRQKSDSVVEMHCTQNSFEADASVTQGDVALTIDSDIFLLASNSPTLQVLVYQKLKNRMQFIDVADCKALGREKLINFSCLSGNDYMPAIYNPQNYLAMFERMSEDLAKSYEAIHASLRNKIDPRFVENEEAVEEVVKNWLVLVNAYRQYLDTRDSCYLDIKVNDAQEMKTCPPSIVSKCLRKFADEKKHGVNRQDEEKALTEEKEKKWEEKAVGCATDGETIASSHNGLSSNDLPLPLDGEESSDLYPFVVEQIENFENTWGTVAVRCEETARENEMERSDISSNYSLLTLKNLCTTS